MDPRQKLALTYLDQDLIDKAEPLVRQLLSEQPDDSFLHAILALCLSEGQHYFEATESVAAAIRLDPESFFAFYVQARLLVDQNCLLDAQGAIKKAIQLSPQHSGLLAYAAQIHFRLGQWADALAIAERGLAIDPDNEKCHNWASRALLRLGQPERARSSAMESLSIRPESAESHAVLGWVKFESFDAQGALSDFRESLRLNPGCELAQLGLVAALLEGGIVRKLLRAITGVIALIFRFPPVPIGVLVLTSRQFQGYAGAPHLGDGTVFGVIVALALANDIYSSMSEASLEIHSEALHAFSSDQRAEHRLVAICVAGIVFSLIGWLTYGGALPFLQAAICSALLTVPAAAINECGLRWQGVLMRVGCVALVLLAISSLVTFRTEPHPLDMSNLLMIAFVLGCIATKIRFTSGSATE